MSDPTAAPTPDSAPNSAIQSAPRRPAGRPGRPALRAVLVAGGTGGHIYPALALGRELRRAAPEMEVVYCCGARPGELRIYEAQDLMPGSERLWVLPMTGRRPGLVNKLRFAGEFARAWIGVRRQMREFRPDLVVGFGNYLSVPALLAARGVGARLALHEQNAHPGLANRWLSRICDRVMTGTPTEPGAFPAAKTVDVGNPVREDLLEPIDRAEARRRLDLPETGPVVLCFGGSLGALGVNQLMRGALVKGALKSIEAENGLVHNAPEVDKPGASLLWATGPQLYEEVSHWISQVPSLKSRVRLFPYLDDMKAAYAASDLVIARAGASTLAEITALGKPSILIPLPTSAGDHQRVNARALERAGAARVIEQADPDGPRRLAEILASVGTPEAAAEFAAMARAARGLGRPQASEAMARAALDLLRATADRPKG